MKENIKLVLEMGYMLSRGLCTFDKISDTLFHIADGYKDVLYKIKNYDEAFDIWVDVINSHFTGVWDD